METIWYCLLWWMLATYVVLDGFDLGAGALHLFVARNHAERGQVIRSVGPVWDGNEVWLLAAGGTMFLSFPVLYAVSFSGFYLPLMMVLWLLVGRALGIELRHQVDDPLWRQFWDAVFAVSSLLLIVFFGAALGNVVRGVPLDESGTFFEPLWTDFRVGARTGILDWYTVLVGATAAAALAHHGALWLAARTDGRVEVRARRAASALWPAVALLAVAATAASFAVQPHLIRSLTERRWGLIFAAATVAGLGAALVLRKRGRPGRAFLASGAFLYGLMGCAASGLFPYLLPARDPALGLTAGAAAAPGRGLPTALAWWIPGMLLVCGYTYFVTYRRLPARFSIRDAPDH
jgi:cytochrome d ubiquinol oxidase subunit II